MLKFLAAGWKLLCGESSVLRLITVEECECDDRGDERGLPEVGAVRCIGRLLVGRGCPYTSMARGGVPRSEKFLSVGKWYQPVRSYQHAARNWVKKHASHVLVHADEEIPGDVRTAI